MTRWSGLLAVLFVVAAAAQQHEPPNALLLVAKPGLQDPNFAETVVLVTQTPDFNTVGVILNRPTRHKLSQFISGGLPTENYNDVVFSGGPVMQQVIVTLFRAERPPAAPAFHVLPNVYLSMHPAILEPLLAGTD